MIEHPILLAEDCENDVAYFEHQLKTAHILNPLQIVGDGEEVIDYLHGNGKFADRSRYPVPLVLFLDLRLPKISGYQVLSFLRATAHYRELPVIVLSCMSEIKDVTEAYQRGANSFLMKPVQAKELLQALNGASALNIRLEKNGFRFEQREFMPALNEVFNHLENISAPQIAAPTV